MMWPFSKSVRPAWFTDFVEAVAAFQAALPVHLQSELVRDGDYFELSIPAPTEWHRSVHLHGDSKGLEYHLGKVWTENLEPSPEVCRRLLASLDAIQAGAVKEVQDVRTGVIYHVYKLRTRGFREFMQDSQYTLWAWLNLKIRDVRIHTLPPLDQKSPA
jgi:hypothetical protein